MYFIHYFVCIIPYIVEIHDHHEVTSVCIFSINHALVLSKDQLGTSTFLRIVCVYIDLNQAMSNPKCLGVLH